MKVDIRNVPKKKLYYMVVTLVLCIGLAGGGIFWQKHTRAQSDGEEILTVRTATVGNSGMSGAYTYAGEVRGRYESQLAFQVNGKIVKRNIQLGSTVQAGDVLMEMDARDIRQTVNSGSAQVASAESQLRLAESNLNRYRQLLESGAISKAQYDQYASSYEVAAAGVRQAAAQYSQGANQLDYSLLKADKAGVITGINAEMGQVVSAGQVVVTLVQDGEREVEISVPENRLEELRKAGTVKVSFWALPNVTVQGAIREIAPMADPTTRTFKVRVTLFNAPAEIKLGMTAAVALATGGQQAVMSIPLAAVYQDGETAKVWVVKEDTVTLRPIQTGSLGNGTIQVVGGLQQGERIVTAGVHKLKEGQKVKVGGDGV